MNYSSTLFLVGTCNALRPGLLLGLVQCVDRIRPTENILWIDKNTVGLLHLGQSTRLHIGRSRFEFVKFTSIVFFQKFQMTDQESISKKRKLDPVENGAIERKVGVESDWTSTIHKAAEAIVSVSFAQASTFDTEAACCSEATGFVIDAAQGLVLTNRHVACSGPWIGELIFFNHEEVDARVVYRDPVCSNV
jgi:S1-C subfamily serine protease